MLFSGKIYEEPLDSVIWAYKINENEWSYTLNAYFDNLVQLTKVEHIFSSVEQNTFSIIDSLDTEGKSYSMNPDKMDDKSIKKPERKFCDTDSLYQFFREKSFQNDKVYITWYVGCFACTKLISELHEYSFLHKRIVLINPVDNLIKAQTYLKKRGYAFANVCLENSECFRIFPSIYIPGETHVSLRSGYSKEIVSELSQE